MPTKDGTGPAGSGPRDGRGQGVGGKRQTSTRKGQGAKSGGKKGGCKQNVKCPGLSSSNGSVAKFTGSHVNQPPTDKHKEKLL